MPGLRPSLVFAIALVAAASPALAQEPDTRAELLRRQREAKATALEPHDPNPVEQAMYVAEERVVPLLQRDGIYARLGSLSTGSGFAYGAGFRNRALVDGVGSLDLWAAGSLKKYWALEARGAYPLTPGRELVVDGHVSRYSRPTEEFFGVGPEARRLDRAAYDLDATEAGARLVAQPIDLVRLGGGVELLRTRAGRGEHDDLPSVDDLFGPASLTSFGETVRFTHASAFFEVDYRQPLNARRGGWYRVDVSRFADTSDGAYTFTRTIVDLRQYFSFLAERRVLAGRAWVATTDVDEWRQVPFYMLPAIGGNDTLRGFRANRFRGPHALVLQGEYRFEIWSALEGALFVDAGKVALRRSDLDLRELEHDYGFGLRFNTNEGVVVRVDAAFGSRDGRHLHVVFGGIF